ncbi:hypothetical protein [Pedobacter cryoconitis]|uniref:Glycosyltransferase RgtA/B/C/D-like domain-containing protein n=1 Tax=Pedobacter cryoconitis TaxID=188932 RepID=A0A327SLX4_9SPHI|nr:hypothetical protein [Pedobacter cryoconitis]RAJ28553.1 hypothetical protein LY11_03204 [Pedobacter cryoconitis]
MNKILAGSPPFKNLDSLFVALIGFILLLTYTRHTGIGISPDSIVYVSVARNIHDYGALLDYTLKPVVDFPVFYPLFLSAASFFSGVDPVAAGPWLNALLFALVIFCTGHLIASFQEKSRFYKLVILLSIAISPAMFDVYAMFWSETLFILLSLLFLIAFRSYLKTRSIVDLLFCALIAAITCVTRYAGITVIATGLMLMVFDRTLEWRKKILHCCLFGFCSVTLLAANLIHNRMVAESLTGPRESGITSLGDNIFYYGKVVCWWLPALDEHPGAYMITAIFLFLIGCAVYLKRAWFSIAYATAENCFAAFFIVYTVFIIGVSTLSHFEQINNRFISPVFIPMLITITCWIPGLIARLPVLKRRIALVGAGLVLIAFQAHELVKLYGMYQEVKDYGIAGYTDDSWKNSQLSAFLRKHAAVLKPEYELYSNAAEAVYFNGGLRATSLPHWIEDHDIHDFFCKEGVYVIWFRAVEDPDLLNLAILRKRADVVKQYSFKDGEIYLVKPHIAP